MFDNIYSFSDHLGVCSKVLSHKILNVQPIDPTSHPAWAFAQPFRSGPHPVLKRAKSVLIEAIMLKYSVLQNIVLHSPRSRHVIVHINKSLKGQAGFNLHVLKFKIKVSISLGDRLCQKRKPQVIQYVLDFNKIES